MRLVLQQKPEERDVWTSYNGHSFLVDSLEEGEGERYLLFL